MRVMDINAVFNQLALIQCEIFNCIYAKKVRCIVIKITSVHTKAEKIVVFIYFFKGCILLSFVFVFIALFWLFYLFRFLFCVSLVAQN
ncbi:hypothetical protein D7I65_22365 [Escherichia albertii]|nr:hypothetical protein [Escherichia albertii]